MLFRSMGRPPAVTMSQVLERADQPDMNTAFTGGDGKRFLHMMSRAGYSPIRNPDNKRGRWPIGDRQWTLIFARNDLQTRERYAAARDVIKTVGDR